MFVLHFASAHGGDEGRDKDPSTFFREKVVMTSTALDLNNKPLPLIKGNGSSIDLNLTQENTKRKRGRPRKGEEGAARLVKWIPKQWTPVYEQIVHLDCMGVSQKKIAEQL